MNFPNLALQRNLALIGKDIRIQFRHGFYYAYLVITLFYLGLLHFLPAEARALALPLVIFSDPAMLGFFFIGALMLFEEDEHSLQGIFTTPVRIRDYITGKLVSLTLIGLLASLILAIAFRGPDCNFVLLFLGILGSSAFFLLVGIIALCKSRDLNSYLLFTPFYIMIFFAPVLGFLDIFHSPLFYLLPTQAALLLIGGAFNSGSLLIGELVYSLLCFAVWIGLAWLWMKRWFARYLIERRNR